MKSEYSHNKPTAKVIEEDKDLAAKISEIFNPKYQYINTRDLLPLSDLGTRWFCEPTQNVAGEKQPSFWLNSEKWQTTLDEFAKLADFFNKKIAFLVRSHEEDISGGFITLTPIVIKTDGSVICGNIKFGLSTAGEVTMHTPAGLTNLGYLNPSKLTDNILSNLQLAT